MTASGVVIEYCWLRRIAPCRALRSPGEDMSKQPSSASLVPRNPRGSGDDRRNAFHHRKADR